MVEGSRQSGRFHEGELMIYWSGATKTIHQGRSSDDRRQETSGKDSWLVPTVRTDHRIIEEEQCHNESTCHRPTKVHPDYWPTSVNY